MKDFGNRPVDLGTLAYHPILAQRDGDILLRKLAANLAPCLEEGIRREFEKLTGLDLRHPEYQTRAGDVVAIAPGIRGEVEDVEQNQLAEELQSLQDLLDGWAGKIEEELDKADVPTPQDWANWTASEKISHLLDRIPKMVEDLKTAKESLERITELETEKTEQQTQIAKLKLRVTQAEEDAKDLFDTQVKLGATESRASRLNDELENCRRELQQRTNQAEANIKDLLDGWVGKLEYELVKDDDPTPQDWDKRTASEKITHLLGKLPEMLQDLKMTALNQITDLEIEKTKQEAQIAKLQQRTNQAEANAKDLFDTQVKLGATESRASRLNAELEECRRDLQNSRQQTLTAEGQIVRLKAELEVNKAQATKGSPESEKLAFLYAQILPAGWENRPDPWAEIQAIFSPEF